MSTSLPKATEIAALAKCREGPNERSHRSKIRALAALRLMPKTRLGELKDNSRPRRLNV